MHLSARPKRIVSLLPAATEALCMLGLQEALVGVSHECDFPVDVVAHLPRLTRPTVPSGLSAAAVDKAVAQQARAAASLYTLDVEMLRQLEPDLILTQGVCDVCAVSADEVCGVAGQLLGKPPVLT